MGMHRALPDAEIIGVDIKPQKHYPFTFIQADAMNPPFNLREFDFIWASPPCQEYSRTAAMHTRKHPTLIAATRYRLSSYKVPYVMENVEDAPLDNCIMLCGSSFELGVRRHRLFESNLLLLSPGCRHDLQPEPIEVVGHFGSNSFHRKAKNLAEARAAMGIDWMGGAEVVQAVPPAYSEFILRQIFPAGTEANK